MRHCLAASLAALSGLVLIIPAPLPAVDISFLDQAPLRYLTDADTRLLDAAIVEVLEGAKDGEGHDWEGAESGNSGSVTAVRSFQKDGHSCRRIEIVTRARQASLGGGKSSADLCRIGGEWKILRIPQ